MDFLVFYKWSVDFRNSPGNAPLLITSLIDMFLKLGSTGDHALYDPSL